ncbi:predicted protein [Naegleria gruberi]|uniref:Predicted protein n=1 Tax=Naegleria gruberi TaxID=5762 RepID=D2W2G6_NAEGR|nr:uncharacterized protein NAEGRDRAFT_75581 [Naegleria gruberi]EFC36707.1 predicted protein [Naegleria gruberi]|eukprot:XP_002669451.1 predicted protein [Naegleria gruberi strain NEG-M]
MAESSWHDLPQVVQLEIFTFLSIKHLGKVLSLSKTIQQQLDESEYFWQKLSVNYARVLDDPNIMEQTKALANDQTEKNLHEKYSNHFELLMKAKDKKKVELQTKVMVEKRRKKLELLRSSLMSALLTRASGSEKKEEKKEENFDLEKEIEKLQFD